MSFAEAHALLIGVGTYRHVPHIDVPITARDAERLRSVLVDPELCGYPDQQLTLLRDKTARRTDILTALDRLAAVSPDATVLLFYCGHGDYGADGDYYLTTHDTEVEGGRIKTNTGVSELELVQKLRDIPAKRLLLFFNACHAGEISPNLSAEQPSAASFGSRTLSPDTAAAILSTGEGRIIITACRPDQKSWIGNGATTIFTTALIEGLSGQGILPNRGGYIGAYDLYEHVYFSVKGAVEQYGQEQEPVLTVLRGIGPFPVALYRGATSLTPFTAPEEPPVDTAVRTVEPVYSQQILTARFDISVSGTGNVTAGRDVRDSTIITGGASTSNDYSGHSIFDQRGQQVKNQYNIAGDYNPTSIQDRAAAIEELRKLIDELNRAGADGDLSTKTAVTARQAVENALLETDEPRPNKRKILSYLANANEIINATAAATGLVNAITQAIQMAEKFF